MAQGIGIVSQAVGTITATNSEGQQREVSMGDQLFDGEIVSAQGSNSHVQVTFGNGCKMSLGEGETAFIDETVYKLEFFDNAAVVVNLETAEGISTEVAEAEDDVVDDIYLEDGEGEGDILADVDLSDMEETAAGATTEVSQVDEADIEERVEFVDERGDSGNDDTRGGTTTDTEVRETRVEQRGGELVDEDTSVSFSILNLDINGFVNSSPVISGNAPEGSQVEFFDNGSTIGTVTVDESESFSFEPSDLEDGEHALSGQVTSTAGTVGEESDPVIFTLDTLAPEQAVIESADLSNTTSTTISGSAESLQSVTVSIGEATYTTEADAQGKWSVDVTDLAEGDNSVAVSVTDMAGNISTTTTTLSVDTTAPDAPVVDSVALEGGIATVVGSSEANSTVFVSIGSQSHEVAADDNGVWSVISADLDEGSFDVSAYAQDGAGNQSATSATQIFTMDTTAPDLPVIEAIDMTPDGLVSISGTASGASEVSLSVGESNYSVEVHEGAWSLTTESLSEGEYLLELVASDLAGNSSDTASAWVLLDTSSVSFEIDYDNNALASQHTIEDVNLYGIKSEDGFDASAQTLDLSAAKSSFVSSGHKGYGVEDGHTGNGNSNKSAIGVNEALVIELEHPVSTMQVSIDKLNFYEGGQWIAYDANMEQVGQSDFGFIDSLFGRDESYESGFFSNGGSLTIGGDDVSADFAYLVLTTDQNWQGKISSYFVEDISYETSEAYVYEMTIENVPLGEELTSLYINGLDEGLSLEDSHGNRVGEYDGETWVIGENEINDLATINGTMELFLASDSEIEAGSIDASISIIETALEPISDSDIDDLSPLALSSVLDFDNIDEVAVLELNHELSDSHSLSLSNVMDLSGDGKTLEIVSGDEGEHSLTLDASEWEAQTNDAGEVQTYENDGNSYTVYSSTQGDGEYDLVVDEMISIVLEQ